MRILVHLHVYYHDQLDEMLGYLSAFEDVPFDLFVTLVSDQSNIRTRIVDFKSDAHIRVVPNSGYDVKPFLEVLRSVDLQNYDYVVKLHTKRTLAEPIRLRWHTFEGGAWRNALARFIVDADSFKKTLKLLKSHRRIGMVSHYSVMIHGHGHDSIADEGARQMLAALELPFVSDLFVAGSMFICRAEIFGVLCKPLPFSFEFNPHSNQTGELAHAYERLFGFIVSSQGYWLVSCQHPFFWACVMTVWNKAGMIWTLVHRKWPITERPF